MKAIAVGSVSIVVVRARVVVVMMATAKRIVCGRPVYIVLNNALIL